MLERGGDAVFFAKIYVDDDFAWVEGEDSFLEVAEVGEAFRSIFSEREISSSDMVIFSAFPRSSVRGGTFLFSHRDHIVTFFAVFLDVGTWGDDLGDFSLHDFSRGGLGGLFGDGDFVAVLDEFGDVFIDAMMGDSCHGDGVLGVFVFAGEDEVKDFMADVGVFEEGFVKVPDTEEEDAIEVLLFHLLVLLHGGGEVHKISED